METIGENLIQVKKERSYISCLVKGCSYGFKHLGLLLRYIWPSLVLSVVLPIPFMFMFAAQMDAILRKWIELDYLPNVTLKSMRREIELCANRSAIKVLIYAFWLFLTLFSFYLTIFLGLGRWWALLVFFLVWLLLLPLSVVIMQVSYSNIPIAECLKGGVKIAYRNFGKLFAFEFLSNLLESIIVLLGGIPLLTLYAVSIQVHSSMVMGDVVDMPFALYGFCYVLAYVICIFILLTILLVFSFSRCLMWGSLVNEVPTETEANS